MAINIMILGMRTELEYKERVLRTMSRVISPCTMFATVRLQLSKLAWDSYLLQTKAIQNIDMIELVMAKTR